MPSLSAASRFAAQTPFHQLGRWACAPIASVDPAQLDEAAIKADETSDTLSLSAAPAKANTTTVNVGTLRVVLPPCESVKSEGDTAERDRWEPPACCCEC